MWGEGARGVEGSPGVWAEAQGLEAGGARGAWRAARGVGSVLCHRELLGGEGSPPRGPGPRDTPRQSHSCPEASALCSIIPGDPGNNHLTVFLYQAVPSVCQSESLLGTGRLF